MAKKKVKRLVGWTEMGNDMRFEGNNPFSEIEIPSIYKTKKGVYFHSHIFNVRDKYKITPINVRITIEEL